MSQHMTYHLRQLPEILIIYDIQYDTAEGGGRGGEGSSDRVLHTALALIMVKSNYKK